MSNMNSASDSLRAMDFERSVDDCFGLLIDDGFRVVSRAPDLVRFRRDNVEVTIYHDVASGEVDLDVGNDAARYSMAELIRSADPKREGEYRSWASTTPSGVRTGLVRLAALLKEFGIGAISGDRFALKRLHQQRLDWLRRYESEVSNSRTRAQAEEAFREGRYSDAVQLLSALGLEATESEKLKLRIAMRRSGNLALQETPSSARGPGADD